VADSQPKIVGYRLSDEEIRALHRPVPGYPSSLNTDCHCPVCDPAFHLPSTEESAP